MSLILAASFLFSVLVLGAITPSDSPLPYREFRRIISVALFAGVLVGHIALRQIRSSEGRVRGFALAIAGLVLGYLEIAFLIATIVIAWNER